MNLFLDDVRIPRHVIYMYLELGDDAAKYTDEPWFVVKTYTEFTDFIREKGMPSLVSFDHDLGIDHYRKQYTGTDLDYVEDFGEEKTGWHCADWLIKYHMDHKGPWPTCWVHSMNPVGKQNLKSLITNYEYVYKLKKH